jgi:hypothetical protein
MSLTEPTEVAGHVNYLVGELLRFNQYGEFRTWRENRKLVCGTELIALMPSLIAGWLRWQNHKRVDQRMGRIADGYKPPLRHTLPDPSAWTYTEHLVLIEPSEGRVFTFTTSSDGGRRTIGDLCRAYGAHCHIDPHSLPVIELGARSYWAHGKTIWAPTFQVVTWR